MAQPTAQTQLHTFAAWLLRPLVTFCLHLQLDPNWLTAVSVVCAGIAALGIAYGQWWLAVVALLLNGVCDMLDGELARRLTKRSQWLANLGAFLDPAVDRVADSILFVGIVAYLLPQGPHWLCLLVVGACAANLVSSWFRAKIESLQRTFQDTRPLTRATFHVQVLASCVFEQYLPGAFIWGMACTCLTTYWTFGQRFIRAIWLFREPDQ